MLKDSFSARLLKKVQMQGGARCEVRGVLSPYVAAPRERANPPQADRWAFFSSLLEEGFATLQERLARVEARHS